jgi:hypothetical protein
MGCGHSGCAAAGQPASSSCAHKVQARRRDGLRFFMGHSLVGMAVERRRMRDGVESFAPVNPDAAGAPYNVM